ncbi:zinc finger protein 845-like isoform X2 [Sitophilus oryzae]|uniref:Zinc finger protein 845-like isoform X2 n=1 Tax=Sitophilus oryzae TaxID=7048 RepID=A0A6J2YCV5_SITOR|nr:zinc finger protein 845-like isoform X2 [Sitophilus oryzae]
MDKIDEVIDLKSITDTTLNNESPSVEHVKQENVSEEIIDRVISDNKLELPTDTALNNESISIEHGNQENISEQIINGVLPDDKLELLKKAQFKVYTCDLCDFQSQYSSSLSKHKKLHLAPEERRMFACVHCDKKYKRRAGLNYHLESNHSRLKKPEQKLYSCSKCDYQSQLMQHLRNHEKVHLAHEERQLFACMHCSKKYMTRYGLDYHLDTNHKNFRSKEVQKKFYKCTICNYRTPHNLNLNKHMVVHLAPEERNLFGCAHCGKKYVQKSTLICHIERYHSRDNSRHKKKVKPVPPEERQCFICAHCEKKYMSRRAIRHHLKYNHLNTRAKELLESQKKVYRCSMCSFQTRCRAVFSTHMNIHLAPEERQWFRCEQCDTKYLNKAALNRHLKHHRIDSRNADSKSLTDEVILDSLKIEIEDHIPLFDDSKNAECPAVINEVKLEDLKIEPDEVASILNEDMHDDFKNTENLSATKKVKLENFIEMEPDDEKN